MWRFLLVVNMILSLTFMFLGEIDRATFHLVWCVLCQLGVERHSA